MQKIFNEPPKTLVVKMTKDELNNLKIRAHASQLNLSQFIRKICK